MPEKNIGELLVEAGLITKEQLSNALNIQSSEIKSKGKGRQIGVILVEMGAAEERDVIQTLAYQLNIPFVDLSEAVITPEALKLVPEKLAVKYNLIPLSCDRNKLTLAMSDPLDLRAIDDVRAVSNLNIYPVVSIPNEIVLAISKHYNLTSSTTYHFENLIKNIEKDKAMTIIKDKDDDGIKDISKIITQSTAPPIVKMVDSIITTALNNVASDIHLEPQKKIVKLRMRIDGIMKEELQIPKWVQGHVTSRIKIMANMDITERRLPQDGRIKVSVNKREVDIRVSTLPTQYGEKVVMRVLDPQSSLLKLNEMGLDESHYDKVRSIIERPQGIILVTGPTGSGKTSTLYAMVNYIKNDRVNIVTLEDPIEYELPCVNQVQINEKTGLTFPYCMRAVLRQDPDVILIGEMRDLETANIAHQASLTGHLVFSTLHTSNAVASIARLKNMGIPPYLIASGLNGIVAQRLVRKICNKCKIKYFPSKEEIARIKLISDAQERITFYKGEGCKNCNFTGYKGRVGIFEVLVADKQIKELITSDASEKEIWNLAFSSGITMYDDGLRKIKNGITTIDELIRVISIQEQESINNHEISEENKVLEVVCPECLRYMKSNLSLCPYCNSPSRLVCSSCNKKTLLG